MELKILTPRLILIALGALSVVGCGRQVYPADQIWIQKVLVSVDGSYTVSFYADTESKHYCSGVNISDDNPPKVSFVRSSIHDDDGEICESFKLVSANGEVQIQTGEGDEFKTVVLEEQAEGIRLLYDEKKQTMGSQQTGAAPYKLGH